MKKILFSLVALVCSMSMSAQVMKIMKNGEEVATYKGANYTVVFEEAPALEKTGTAKRTGDIDVNWVQLWENGPKFAEYNVGAANNKAEDYGGYYCWGKSTDKDQTRSFKEGESALTGTDDTATNLWGSAWRMPTEEELQALLENCDVEWTAVNGVNGRKFTGKNDYASNSIFLPAAGQFGGRSVELDGNYGYYWSSTPNGSSNRKAEYLFFRSDLATMSGDTRNYGSSVRAVLAEEEINSTTGTAKATIGNTDVNVTWIQLWENGPKFAEYNVGVTDGKAESYGGYYCWGSSIDKDPSAAYKEGESALTGTDDTATNLWGNNWRMPTEEELQALLDHCNVELTDDYNSTGVKGRIFTGKVAPYTENSIFLPAAGYYSGVVYGQGLYGYYWSSTPGVSNNAYYLRLNNSDVYSYARTFGVSVRAVLAE